MSKILLVNKSQGPTSHDVVEKIRKKYPGEKVGHAGTLDPMATGLLIILIGGATKKQAEFMGLEKEYKIEITFGRETDTYDAEGKVINEVSGKGLKDLTGKRVEEALKNFRGEIEQTVPPYSAVKVKGKKLYELARKGKLAKTKLPKRRVQIKEIEFLNFRQLDNTSPPRINLRIVCSKGTYMRSLAHDLGKQLRVGGYLSKITRTRIGSYKLEQATPP